MMPSPPPNGSSSSPSFFCSRFTLARHSLFSDLAPFLAADLWERRPRHGSSGARLHRRQRAAAARREIDHRLLQLRSSASVVDSHSTGEPFVDFLQ
uniref:Uncharacterized protein n=1 Tax=Oryza rufipogon TaxID=4529 RepID=A0A0E0P4S4_ORYRU